MITLPAHSVYITLLIFCASVMNAADCNQTDT